MTRASQLALDAAGRARLASELRQNGFALVRPPDELGAAAAAQRPWECVAQLLGEPALLVERQPIAPVSWGRSFASTAVTTPLHTDSQLFAGVPPQLQLMFCERAASEGGETLLLDTHRLLERLELGDPELLGRLFTETRRIPFVFGDVLGPTVSWRGGCLVFTHSPMPATDELGRRLAERLADAPVTQLAVQTGELLLVDNHRMLHGRTAFTGSERSFTRVLAWLERPFSEHQRFVPIAEREAERAAAKLAESERRSRGLAAPTPSETTRRRLIVLEMLRGVPPGVLAARHGVAEPTLYGWRDAALSGMDRELGDD